MSRDWSEGLVGAARNIAELNHTHMRVMAGPGTGKTFAMMRRVARLLTDGQDPRRLLVCTFTRTAARDLAQELERLGYDGADQVRTGTLHSICFSLLGQADVFPITGRTPRPLLRFEERFLLEDTVGSGLRGIRARRKRLEDFNSAWARLQSDTPGWPTDPLDKLFQRLLHGWLRFHEAMLVGELIPEALQYLRNNPTSPHRRAFDHVLVDEYQDLNKAEQVLLDHLAGNQHFLVIGDEDQSIYSFKNAHPEGVVTFDQTHARTHDEVLDICRRCPKTVVDLANALIVHNVGRQPRSLRKFDANPDGEMLNLQWTRLEAESEGIATLIHRRVQRAEYSPGQILVLSPRRKMGYAVRDALKALGVSAHSFFHEEALDGDPKKPLKCVAQEAFTLLTLLAYPNDRVALRCWCGFGHSSLRRPAWDRLRRHCETSNLTPREVLERLSDGTLTIRGTAELVRRFQALQSRLAILGPLKGLTLVDAIFPASSDWADDFRALAAEIEEEDFDAKALRDSLRIGITQPELPTDVDYVRVMSLHKSKGLTSDLVIVVGCIEGLIPTIDDELTPADQAKVLEEQRRLFYVAITRPRQALIMSSASSISRRVAHKVRAKTGRGNPTHARTLASRFMSELGPLAPVAQSGTDYLESTAR